jgi:hypothetical protein
VAEDRIRRIARSMGDLVPRKGERLANAAARALMRVAYVGLCRNFRRVRYLRIVVREARHLFGRRLLLSTLVAWVLKQNLERIRCERLRTAEARIVKSRSALSLRSWREQVQVETLIVVYLRLANFS